jgi:hypothetical protein
LRPGVYFTASPVVWLLTPPGRARVGLSFFFLCKYIKLFLIFFKKKKKKKKNEEEEERKKERKKEDSWDLVVQDTDNYFSAIDLLTDLAASLTTLAVGVL